MKTSEKLEALREDMLTILDCMKDLIEGQDNRTAFLAKASWLRDIDAALNGAQEGFTRYSAVETINALKERQP